MDNFTQKVLPLSLSSASDDDDDDVKLLQCRSHERGNSEHQTGYTIRCCCNGPECTGWVSNICVRRVHELPQKFFNEEAYDIKDQKSDFTDTQNSEHIKRLLPESDLYTSNVLATNVDESTLPPLPPLPPAKKRKYRSRKADEIEKQIQDLLHTLYDSRTSENPALLFKFEEPICSTTNEAVRESWRKLLLERKPEKYKEQDWSEERLNGRLTRLFWSKKYSAKKTDIEKELKRTRDRRNGRMNDKRNRRLKALHRLVDNHIISKQHAHDVLVHINAPSDEESETDENDSEGKIVKVALAEHRSDQLKRMYDLIDNERAQAKRGGSNAAGQRLARIPWKNRFHSIPPGAAAWTLRPKS